jgi:hypothetical protein
MKRWKNEKNLSIAASLLRLPEAKTPATPKAEGELLIIGIINECNRPDYSTIGCGAVYSKINPH